MDGTRSVGSPNFHLDPEGWRGMGEEWVDAVQRLGIPGRTLGRGGCGAERENKDFVNFIIFILLPDSKVWCQ